MSDAAAPPSGSPEILDALRRVKATEADWDRRLADARAAAAQDLAGRRDAAEASVHEVARAVETERAEATARAGREGDTEARTIVDDGEAEARQLRAGQGSLAEGRRKEILAVVLGRFASD